MYQFIHIEVYAEKVSKQTITRREKLDKNGKRKSGTKSPLNVRQVIAEAKREKGAHPHVINPQPPIKIYGITLDEVESLAIKSKEGKFNIKGKKKKVRIDAPILLAGVASYPYEEYNTNQQAFESWLKDNVDWLIKIYGDNLKNVTLHLDETHPHIHFYAISLTGRVKDIHHGYQADRQVVDRSDNKSKNLAYVEAMRNYQDQYYWDVASNHGMLRIGANQLRKPNAEYRAEKANAKLLANKIHEVELIEQEATLSATVKSNSMIKETKLQIDRMLINAHNEIKQMQELALRETKRTTENLRKLSEAEAKVKKLEAEMVNKENELDYFVNENLEMQRRLKVEGIAI